MSRLLIVYGTNEGHTEKIGKFLEHNTWVRNHYVNMYDCLDFNSNPENYDTVIIAASMHGDEYQESVYNYVKEYSAQLNQMNTGFVSVSALAAHEDDKSKSNLVKITNKFLKETGWNPTKIEYAAGALNLSKHNPLQRFFMKLFNKSKGGRKTREGNYEYTNWDNLSAFLTSMLTRKYSASA